MNKLNEKIAADLFLIYGFNARVGEGDEWKKKTRSSSLRTINKIAVANDRKVSIDKEIEDKDIAEILGKWNQRTRTVLSHSNEKLFGPDSKMISEFESSIEKYLQEVYEPNKEKIISANKDYLYKGINLLFRKYLDNQELKFRLESLAVLSMAFFLYKFELSGLLNPNNSRLKVIFDNDPKIEEVLNSILKEEVVTHTEIIGDQEFQTKYDDLQIRGWNLYNKLKEAPDLAPKNGGYSFFSIADVYTLLRLVSEEDVEYFSSKDNFLLEENYGIEAPAKENGEQKEVKYKRPNVINYSKLNKNKVYFIKISNNEFNLFSYANNLKKGNLKDNLLNKVKELKNEEGDINKDSFLKNYKDNKLKWYTIHFNLKNIFSFLHKNSLLIEKKSLVKVLQDTSNTKENPDQKNKHYQSGKFNEFHNKVKQQVYLTKEYHQTISPRKDNEIKPTFLKEFLSTVLKNLGTYLGKQNTQESERIKVDKSSIDQFYSHFYGDLNLLLAKDKVTYKDIIDFQPYSEQIVQFVIDAIDVVFGNSLQVDNFIETFFVKNNHNQRVNDIYYLLILERQKNKQKMINNKKVFYKAYLSSFIYLAYQNDPSYEVNKQEVENFLLNSLLALDKSNKSLSYDNQQQELTIILKYNNRIVFKNLVLPINREAIKLIAYIFNRSDFKEAKNYEFNYSKINRSKFLMTTNPIDKDTDLIQFLSNDQLIDFVIWAKNERDSSKPELKAEIIPGQKTTWKDLLNVVMHSRFISPEIYAEFKKAKIR